MQGNLVADLSSGAVEPAPEQEEPRDDQRMLPPRNHEQMEPTESDPDARETNVPPQEGPQREVDAGRDAEAPRDRRDEPPVRPGDRRDPPNRNRSPPREYERRQGDYDYRPRSPEDRARRVPRFDDFEERYRNWEKEQFPVSDPTREWEYEMRRRELLGEEGYRRERERERAAGMVIA